MSFPCQKRNKVYDDNSHYLSKEQLDCGDSDFQKMTAQDTVKREVSQRSAKRALEDKNAF